MPKSPRLQEGAFRLAIRIVMMLAFLLPQPLRADDLSWQDTLDYAKVRASISANLKRVQENPKDYDLRIKVATLSFYGWRLEKDSNRNRFELAKLVAKMGKEAIEIDEKRPEGYLWAGAGLGCVGLTRGILSSLQLIPQGKEYLEKSIAADPLYLDAAALSLMGRAYTVVPGFPLSVGDKAKAMEYLLLARKKAPSSTLVDLFLADLLWAYGRDKDAIELLEKLPENKPKNELEYFLFETNKRKAKEIIALIKSGKPRDPFFDVVSDIQPGIFE